MAASIAVKTLLLREGCEQTLAFRGQPSRSLAAILGWIKTMQNFATSSECERCLVTKATVIVQRIDHFLNSRGNFRRCFRKVDQLQRFLEQR